MFPHTYISNYNPRKLKLSNWVLLVYPYIHLNDTLGAVNFNTSVVYLKSGNSDQKFKIKIEVDKEYFYKQPNITKMYFGSRSRFDVEIIKDDEELLVDKADQADSSNVIIDIYTKNVTNNRGYNHYQNDFQTVKDRIVKDYYNPRRPINLYNRDPLVE